MGSIVPTDREAYNSFKRGQLPGNYPGFSAAVYSLENSLPLVKLGQADKWQPDPGRTGFSTAVSDARVCRKWLTSPPFLIWFLRAQILLDWVLATFFAAGVSGIVHKQ